MKKVHFMFLNNDELVLDFSTFYSLVDGYMTFDFDGVSYGVKLQNGFEFHKVTEGEEFILRENKTCEIVLKDLGKSFDIPVIALEFTNNGNNFVVKYALESDIGSSKTINLTFNL